MVKYCVCKHSINTHRDNDFFDKPTGRENEYTCRSICTRCNCKDFKPLLMKKQTLRELDKILNG